MLTMSWFHGIEAISINRVAYDMCVYLMGILKLMQKKKTNHNAYAFIPV